MGKKTKSKQRLDVYYRYAKSQGYRSRAAYKLIQLNRKYNFLSNSTTLVDLCAAPGGWMQVAKEFMPLNSTIIGVDLDPIKKVPGTQSFIGDITTQTCYETLKKMLNTQKCQVVLNDGAPNVGANWSKDAYTQSELVLWALKLACNFLQEGGFFVTKVFRSTDFQSLMWVFKKFFEKVQATKPKASRFVSAEIFVVCSGFLAPEYIDEKLFDAKYIFKDTEADHYHEQMVGDITSIDKLLENRRRRGGYEDNAPQHLYKETSLTHFINSRNPLLIFAQFNRITVSQQERQQYFECEGVKRMPSDMIELLQDLKVLGKREVGSIMKWRSKIAHQAHIQSQKQTKRKTSDIGLESRMEQADMDSSQELEMQVLHEKKKEIRSIREKEERKQELMLRAQLVNEQHQGNDQELDGDDFGEILQDANVELEDLGFEEEPLPTKPKGVNKRVIDYNAQQMEDNLEQMYESRKAIIEEKQQQDREKREARKNRQQERYQNKEDKLKSRPFRLQPYSHELDAKGHTQAPQKEVDFEQVRFRNPLAGMEDEDDDLYLSENSEENYKAAYDDNEVDPDEQMDGEVLDDDAYVIKKPVTEMEKRRKQLKRAEKKKENKLKKSIVEGEDVNGQIEIVKNRQMEDYNIDSLAETLAIAKKMARAGSREEIVENSYRGLSFQDHDGLPRWFTDDEKRHNYKKDPITKEEFQQEKERLMAINARIPKKIMEAKVRKKIRMQKKLKKVQKKAEMVMAQEGINQVSKLRQVGKMYDKEKRSLKDSKKYVRSKKSKTSDGKDTRNLKHVDNRLKKDKRSQKISKTRHVHRKNTKRARF